MHQPSWDIEALWQKTLITAHKKQHSSVFIAVLSIAFVLGVVVAATPFLKYCDPLSWIIASCFLLFLSFWKRQTWMLLLVVVAGLLLGMVRSLPLQESKSIYQNYMNKQETVYGKVIEDTEKGKKGDTRIRLGNISINNQKLSGNMWVSTQDKVGIKRGYEVYLSGTLKEGFGSFSATMYRAKVVSVHDPHTDKARESRDWFSSHIKQNIPDPQAGLGLGFLVGQHASLPDDFLLALQIVGLTHIIVASGYNLTILVRIVKRIFAKISKYQVLVFSALLVIGFLFVTGFSPSIVRAAIVTLLSLATWYYGRNIHPLVLLAFSAAISLVLQPSFAWGDLGWYLSFAAFAGVMVLAPLLQDFFFGPKKPGLLRQIMGETLSAQILTLPIIAFSFGTISLFALPANLLVLPFVPLAMLLVFIAGLANVIFPVIGMIVAIPANILLEYMVRVVNFIAQLPHASIEVTFGIFWLGISYIIIVVVCVFLQRVTKHTFTDDNLVE